MTKLERPVMAAIFTAFLLIVRQKKIVFKIEPEIDDDMKFGKNPIKND